MSAQPCRHPALGLALVLCLTLSLAGSRAAPAARGDPAEVPSSNAPEAASRWVPQAGSAWQVQYTGSISTSVQVPVYDLDMSVSSSIVARLHALGRRVICYIDAGTWEDFRPDRSAFPASVIGRLVDGWPGERWLDIRQTAVLAPIMARRMDICRAKGFDAVDPDNVDGYQNDTGFRISADHQRRYNMMLSSMAHARGLAIGLKNDVDQAVVLQPYFDFAVNEQCVLYAECDVYRAFLSRHKPVFHVEYVEEAAARKGVCRTSRALGLSTVIKGHDLDASRIAC